MNQPTAMREKGVPMCLGRLETATARIGDLAEKLENALASVLASSISTNVADGDPKSPEPSCDLVGEVDRHADNLGNVAGRFESMLGRLEL